MSWSICFIGKPANLVAAIEAESVKLTDQCKVEFDAAAPHLIALVKENFVVPEKTGYQEPVLRLTANGSGCVAHGEQVQRSCLMQIEPIYGKLV